VQASVLWALQKGYFDSIEVKQIVAASNSLKEFLTSRKDALLTKIRTKAALDAEIETELKSRVRRVEINFRCQGLKN
jgi:F-type H+-transporting ATPase subunit alpha